MVRGVAWRGKKVEGAIVEIVDGGEAANTETRIEFELPDRAAGGVGGENWGGGLGGVRRLELAAETRADD